MNSGFAIAKEKQPNPSEQLSMENTTDSKALGNQLEQQYPLFLSGVMAYRAKDYEEAEKIIRHAIELGHQNPCLYIMLGSVLFEKGKSNDAARCLKKAIEIDSDYVDAYFKLGRLYYMEGKFKESTECFKKCIQLKPEYHDAYFKLGFVFHKQGLLPDALSYYQKAIKLQPGTAQSYLSLGSVFQQQGHLEKAVYCYKKAIKLNPDFASAYNNMGVALQKLSRFNQAISCYKKTLIIKSDYAPAYVNMGNLYFDINMYGKAVESYDSALEINPNNASTLFNMGNTLEVIGKETEAKKRYKRALELRPEMEKACARLLALLQHDCEWGEFEHLSNTLDRMTYNAIKRGYKPMETAFLNISRHINPELNFIVARLWGNTKDRHIRKEVETLSHSRRKKEKGKIKLGYLSNNYRNHPNAQLTVDLFKKHKREDFDVFCYSYGKNDGSSYRKNIEGTCDKFIDLKNHDNFEASKRIYQDEVDILIDLIGQTDGSRMGICAFRPAPIQVRYLGMAGTTGVDYFDYIITDRIVTPETDAGFYSETFVFMPHCYQVNSTRVARSHKAFTRQNVGLPEESFVFCCFNSSYKIDPIVFDVWMNILKRVSRGILWLMKGSDQVESNLILEAEKRGVSRDRLFFTDKLPIQDHLARLQLADLALDTRIVTGAATTSDALWAGIPVVTMTGGHFASRMSSSILSALELQDLVVDNLKAYEDLAVNLSMNPGALMVIRNKLKENSKIMPLFDTDRFVGNIETAYKNMYQNYIAGNDPVLIHVIEDTI